MTRSAMLAGEQPQLPETAWRLTAPPLPPFASLQSDVETDVVVVGGGFVGLMAAITLREGGHHVVLIDAVEPGWGASGRNNGQVIPGFKCDPDELKSQFGAKAGERLAEFGGHAPDIVFDTIAKHDVQCFPVRNGFAHQARRMSSATLLTTATRATSA
jgi:glycine/D-amino acid oxidase-like deaminating enzyme